MTRIATLALCLLLAACGGSGGGGGSSGTPAPPLAGYTDPNVYSSAQNASLATPNENVATSKHAIVLNGATRSYTAKAGHLTVPSASGQAQASMFYVSYTLDDADAAMRPVMFFYNGGPGSATVWLHLGSFGPRRIATDTPGAGGSTPYPIVDNAETLLDTTDLVFIDMVGSGYSQAIAPFTNVQFWGVDVDAALFRDFIQRWLAVNARGASPKFLLGESYGGVRSAVLANLLEAAGVSLRGVVLLSPALDYNSNCGLYSVPTCASYLPSYHAAATWHRVATPDVPPQNAEASILAARAFADTVWDPAIAAFRKLTPPDPQLVAQLSGMTGIASPAWQVRFNMDPTFAQDNVVPGRVLGRYDARVSAAVGSSLAAGHDPSSTYVSGSFGTRIGEYLRNELGFTTPSGYTMLSNALASWVMRHDGRDLPDTIPDLGAALAQNPKLKVFSTGGYHDLATPFHLTENDTARLGASAPITHRYYFGGHMTYLDDASRQRQKADVAQFVRGAL